MGSHMQSRDKHWHTHTHTEHPQARRSIELFIVKLWLPVTPDDPGGRRALRVKLIKTLLCEIIFPWAVLYSININSCVMWRLSHGGKASQAAGATVPLQKRKKMELLTLARHSRLVKCNPERAIFFPPHFKREARLALDECKITIILHVWFKLGLIESRLKKILWQPWYKT